MTQQIDEPNDDEADQDYDFTQDNESAAGDNDESDEGELTDDLAVYSKHPNDVGSHTRSLHTKGLNDKVSGSMAKENRRRENSKLLADRAAFFATARSPAR